MREDSNSLSMMLENGLDMILNMLVSEEHHNHV